MSHEAIQLVIFGVLACAVLFVGWKVGRRWRRGVPGRLSDYRAQLESDNRAQAEALSAVRAEVSASSHGNVVVIGDGEASSLVSSPLTSAGQMHRGPGLWVPAFFCLGVRSPG